MVGQVTHTRSHMPLRLPKLRSLARVSYGQRSAVGGLLLQGTQGAGFEKGCGCGRPREGRTTWSCRL